MIEAFPDALLLFDMRCPRENIKKADAIVAGLFYETVPA
jgi:hypothetical protein